MAIGWVSLTKSRWKKRANALRRNVLRVPVQERHACSGGIVEIIAVAVEDQLSSGSSGARQMLMKALQAIEEEAEELAQEPRKDPN